MPTISRPNLLLILCQGVSAQDLLHFPEATSALSSLAETGQSFDCTLPDPRSGPMRATMMTGRWPLSHGLWADGAALPLREELVSQQLAAAGYDCGLVGASHLAPVAGWRTEARRDDDGFRVWNWAHDPAHRSRQNAYIAALKAHHPEIHDQLFAKSGNPDEAAPDPALVAALAALPEEFGFNRWVSDSSLAFINTPRPAHQPWFLVAGFQVVGAHNAATLADLNAGVARLVAALPPALHDDTLILLTTDIATGEARTAADLSVPFIVNWPGHLPATTAKNASPVDIAPTLCAAAGLTLRARHQGRSLFGAQAAQAHDDITTLRDGTHDHLTRANTAISVDGYRLILDHTNRQTALYDLRHDPDERSNLAGDPAHADRIETMTDRLLSALVAREDLSQPRLGGF
ncbi:sulfatase-like hydrolase/transferase [Pseudorhodobacter sp. W20_MBD10_FR17]|uniref:sulfatase-like hydrolase/transferase n=1 Tax=Pseudorhodobacter sp. W20_MBD10_FR17 TaxID=3240266 RepID=UPI003F94BDF7